MGIPRSRAEMGYTTIKLSRDVKRRLEEYARPRGLTLSAAVQRLIEDADIKPMLSRIIMLLEEQNSILREILQAVSGSRGYIRESIHRETPAELEDVPSFAEDNPWIAVLKGRGR